MGGNGCRWPKGADFQLSDEQVLETWCTGRLLLFSYSVMSDSLQPHRLQHTRLLCPPLSPRVHSVSCPLSWWCHPTVSSSVVPFFSCLQSFPASGSFLMSQFLHIRWPMHWSFSFSISPSSEYSGLISFRIDQFDLLLSKGLSRVLFSTTFQKRQFFGPHLSYGPILTSIHDYWKSHNSNYTDLCWQSDVSSLLFNMLSRLVIAFLPRSKRLLTS